MSFDPRATGLGGLGLVFMFGKGNRYGNSSREFPRHEFPTIDTHVNVLKPSRVRNNRRAAEKRRADPGSSLRDAATYSLGSENTVNVPPSEV
jgi:hypothetical protein